ncbi:hypothetical protein ACP0IX_02585 [Pseudomonas aeruginosa]
MQQNENFAKQAEQAEAERPELWAVHAQGPDELYAAFSREDAEKHAAELNALPMPEGIAVGAVVVPSPWPAVQHWQYLAEQEQDHKNEIAGRLRQFERICEGLPQGAIDGGWTVHGIRGYAKRLEDQLKAAQARVAELEGKLTDWVHEGFRLNEALAVAKAQHSVPEGWMLVECGIWTQEQVDEMQKTVARFRNSEFVDDRALAMAVADAGQCKAPEISLAELLAAAPGKEVPQAWLEVQAERKRQVEVEGYHGFRDSHYINYELSKAARAYIEVSWHALSGGLPCKKPESWPWMAGFKWADGRTMLVKAGALILAEIERLDRAAAPGKEVGHE